jgi:hypothetical protein
MFGKKKKRRKKIKKRPIEEYMGDLKFERNV